jgi:hypothetical protein
MSTATGTTRTASARRTAPLRLPRTTGAVSGLLILVLGIWGGLIPFIGPYFHYAFGGSQTWHFTTQRLWLDIVPGAVAVIGGFMLLTAATRVGGLTAGWVALAAGAWFIVGPVIAILWHHTLYAIGAPMGGATRQMLEWIGYFFGVGTVIVGLAAFAMGRYFSRPRVAEEPVVAAGAATAGTAAVADRPVADRPVADRPVADRPVADRPVAERAAADRAALADRPVADRPVADRPVADRPVADRPVADRPVADRPVADRAVADRAVADEPVADRTTTGAAATGTAASGTAATDTGATRTGAYDTGAAGNAPAGAVASRRRRGGLMGRLFGPRD